MLSQPLFILVDSPPLPSYADLAVLPSRELGRGKSKKRRKNKGKMSILKRKKKEATFHKLTVAGPNDGDK